MTGRRDVVRGIGREVVKGRLVVLNPVIEVEVSGLEIEDKDEGELVVIVVVAVALIVVYS